MCPCLCSPCVVSITKMLTTHGQVHNKLLSQQLGGGDSSATTIACAAHTPSALSSTCRAACLMPLKAPHHQYPNTLVCAFTLMLMH